jgi:ATP-binding cassette subfamily B (MDR/TAP) protein 1
LFTYTDKKLLFAFGILVAMANGSIFPIFSIFLSKMLAVLLSFTQNPGNSTQARSDANTYALIYLILAIAAFIFNILQQTIFTNIGESVTEKLRNETYLKILKMPVRWFDKPRNSSGSLSARLASDCHSVNGLVTTFFSISVQSATTLIVGCIIAFIYEWRTTLVAFALLPLLILSGVIQMSFMNGFSDKTDKAYKESSNLITEAMNNIRTVNSFGT